MAEAMDYIEFKHARERLHETGDRRLSQFGLALVLGVRPDTLKRWELDPVRFEKKAKTPPAVAARALSWMLAGFIPPELALYRARLAQGAADAALADEIAPTVMTPEDFVRARRDLGLEAAALAHVLGAGADEVAY